jgi:dTMP kinase
MSPNRCFQSPPPDLDLSRLTGLLIVIEGPDSSGRSTHVGLLTKWLVQKGYSVVQTGLRRSMLVGPELDQAKKGNTLSPRTMSLFYATDFYDQMENVLVPALHSGAVALADRYIFTLMARDLVRGTEPAWIESLYSRALVADAVFYLKVPLPTLVMRTLHAHGRLDYWESGMDLGLSRDWFDSFLQYQRRLNDEFMKLHGKFNFDIINANRSVQTIQKDLRGRVERLLASFNSDAQPG